VDCECECECESESESKCECECECENIPENVCENISLSENTHIFKRASYLYSKEPHIHVYSKEPHILIFKRAPYIDIQGSPRYTHVQKSPIFCQKSRISCGSYAANFRKKVYYTCMLKEPRILPKEPYVTQT